MTRFNMNQDTLERWKAQVNSAKVIEVVGKNRRTKHTIRKANQTFRKSI